MKVFVIRGTGQYSAAMAVVGAESRGEACRIAAMIPRSVWTITWAKPNDAEELDDVTYAGAPRVLSYFEFGE